VGTSWRQIDPSPVVGRLIAAREPAIRYVARRHIWGARLEPDFDAILSGPIAVFAQCGRPFAAWRHDAEVGSPNCRAKRVRAKLRLRTRLATPEKADYG
jgi:hypothetical protein